MLILRSLLFNLLFYAWSLPLAVLYLPLLLAPRRVMVNAARFWITGVFLLLRFAAGLRFTVRGHERLPEGSFLVAAKHQSAFDTFVFHMLFADPCFVLKKELLSIPLFGWYLQKHGMVAIDRKAGIRALKLLMTASEQVLERGSTVIIFPEGTRVPPGESRPYQPGVAAMYGALNRPVVPVALNSGLFWRRNGFLKRPGDITVEILPAIQPGMDRRAFGTLLENQIETATRALEAEATAKNPALAG